MMLSNLAFLMVASLSCVNAKCLRNGLICLDYTVLETHEGYEVRSYPPITWVSASAEGMRMKNVSRYLSYLVIKYLAGGNDRRQGIGIGNPWRTKKVVNRESNTYTLAVSLPPESSKNPPKPLNPNVTVTSEPSTVYVVRAFGGQAWEDDIWDNQAEGLKNDTANDASVDTSFYYMSDFDSMRNMNWPETNRLNEVWMVKRPE